MSKQERLLSIPVKTVQQVSRRLEQFPGHFEYAAKTFIQMTTRQPELAHYAYNISEFYTDDNHARHYSFGITLGYDLVQTHLDTNGIRIILTREDMLVAHQDILDSTERKDSTATESHFNFEWVAEQIAKGSVDKDTLALIPQITDELDTIQGEFFKLGFVSSIIPFFKRVEEERLRNDLLDQS